MLIFFAFVSLANLVIGYVVAVKFHSLMFAEPTCERELVRNSAELLGGVPPFSIDGSRMPLVNPQAPLVAMPPENIALEIPEHPPQPGSATLNEAPELPAANVAEPLISRLTESHPEDKLKTGRRFKSADENLSTVSVDDFMRGISDFRAQLAALDQRVRKCAKSPDSRQIEGCVQEFREANSRYLEHTTEVKDRLEQAQPGEGAVSVREAMEQALAQQVEEVRNTESKLSQLDIAADPEGSCEALLNTAHALARSNDKLRDELELAKRDLEPDTTSPEEPELSLDELTQIPNRQMFDWEVHQHLRHGENFYLAVADVDHCSQLNLSYGPTVTDEVLKVIAQVVAASARGNCRAARYSGQQFAVMFPGQQVEGAILAVENIRQIIQVTKFQHEETQLDVSVSVTLIPAQAHESFQVLENRIGEAVAAAKCNERNHSYQFQDGDVEPIFPLELDLQVNSYEV